jgi:hypothetical protein
MISLTFFETLRTHSVDWGEMIMLRTISLGTCVSVQGQLVSQLADGKIVVRVDGKTFVGYPVNAMRKS